MGLRTDVDHQAIEELAEHYSAKGRAVGRIGVGSGAVVGVLVGSVPLTPLSFVWPIPSTYGLATVLLGLGIGLLIGYVIGDSRARMYHRMAEQARAQLVLEERISKSDARVAQLVAALNARARAATPSTPAPTPPAEAPASTVDQPTPTVEPPVSALPLAPVAPPTSASDAPAQPTPSHLRPVAAVPDVQPLTSVPPSQTATGSGPFAQFGPPVSPPPAG